MAQKQNRRSQPSDLNADEMANIWSMHTPEEARVRVRKTGNLFLFRPTRAKGIIDRAAMEFWQPAMLQFLKLNPTGIFNVTTIAQALHTFDKSMGAPMGDEQHECNASNGVEEHRMKQAYIWKRYFQGLARIKSNSSNGSRHASWLRQLLDALTGQGDNPESLASCSPTESFERSPSPKAMDNMVSITYNHAILPSCVCVCVCVFYCRLKNDSP